MGNRASECCAAVRWMAQSLYQRRGRRGRSGGDAGGQSAPQAPPRCTALRPQVSHGNTTHTVWHCKVTRGSVQANPPVPRESQTDLSCRQRLRQHRSTMKTTAILLSTAAMAAASPQFGGFFGGIRVIFIHNFLPHLLTRNLHRTYLGAVAGGPRAMAEVGVVEGGVGVATGPTIDSMDETTWCPGSSAAPPSPTGAAPGSAGTTG